MSGRLSVEYLRSQLAEDPRTAALRIIASRNVALGLLNTTDSVARPSEPGYSVSEAHAQLAKIRAEFWNMPLSNLQAELDRIESPAYPEISAVSRRLQQAALQRDNFAKLESRLAGNLGLFHFLQEAITMPPRDAAGMKETVMRSMMIGQHSRDYTMDVQLIKQEFPGIYALEQAWLESILAARKHASSTAALKKAGPWGVPLWVWIFLSLLVLKAVLRLVR